jgi:SAM-dependent methyltransferase
MSQTDATTYDEGYIKWKRWDGVAFATLRADAATAFRVEVKRASIDHIRNVVEIGFGTGAFMAYAKQRGWDVVGVEVNHELVEIARHNGYTATNPAGFAQLPDASIDLIAAFDVLEHLTHGQIDELLPLIYAKLRPGGALLARFPNGDSPMGLCNQNGDVTHVTAIGVEKIRYFARMHRFQMGYLGPEAMPIMCGHLKHSVHRLVAVPISRVLDAITGPLFFPGFGVSLFSRNLVAVLKKP